MKRILIIALVIVCGVVFSDNFAKKPKKVVASESRQAALDSLRMEQEKEELELQ